MRLQVAPIVSSPRVCVAACARASFLPFVQMLDFFPLGLNRCFKRSRNPVARVARRPIAARTDASDPTTRTFALARVTAV